MLSVENFDDCHKGRNKAQQRLYSLPIPLFNRVRARALTHARTFSIQMAVFVLKTKTCITRVVKNICTQMSNLIPVHKNRYTVNVTFSTNVVGANCSYHSKTDTLYLSVHVIIFFQFVYN